MPLIRKNSQSQFNHRNCVTISAQEDGGLKGKGTLMRHLPKNQDKREKPALWKHKKFSSYCWSVGYTNK